MTGEHRFCIFRSGSNEGNIIKRGAILANFGCRSPWQDGFGGERLTHFRAKVGQNGQKLHFSSVHFRSNVPATKSGDVVVADPIDFLGGLLHLLGARFSHFGPQTWPFLNVSQGP